jgi:uncharacterized membrane protein YeaQ/YmgE (transglycosylase-associated protein family)
MFDLMNPYEVGLDIVLLAIGLVIGLLAGLFARGSVFFGLHIVVATIVGGIGGLVIGRLLVAAGLGTRTMTNPLAYAIDTLSCIAGILGAVILLLVVGFLWDKVTAKAPA